MNKRRYHFKERYFQVIDTQEKAYLLGFLYADGCVASNLNRVVISLHRDDVEILEMFRRELDFKGPIYPNRNGNGEATCVGICMCSILLVQDLIRLGCHPRKSLTLKFPTQDQVPEHLIRHFIRGYFDGDGSIWHNDSKRTIKRLGIVRHDKTTHVGVISTFNFCKGFRARIESLGITRFKIFGRRTKQKRKIYSVYYNWKDTPASKVPQIYKYFYEGASLFLARKKLRFERSLKRIEEAKASPGVLYGIDSYVMSIVHQGQKSSTRSKYIGVNRTKTGWITAITKDGRAYCRSSQTQKKAAILYDKMATVLYGKNALLNFPNETYQQEDLDKVFVHFTTVEKTSKFKYVDLMKNGMWRAMVGIGPQKAIVRTSDNEVEAAEWADALRVFYLKKEDFLNFPDKLGYYRSLDKTYFEKRERKHRRGVKYCSQSKKWKASLDRKLKRYECGLFDTRQEAFDALNKKREEIISLES